MADNRTMAQMLQAPIEGYEDEIVVPPINANNFELKQTLINLVQSNQFTGRQDPHNIFVFYIKKFEEDLLTYCGKNETSKDFKDISESSDDNTNVVNALQEPIIVNQDPDEKSSQGAHYGYNCPPKVPIISNPEQCNQTIAELPQTLPIVHPTCNYENENSFIYDSKPNSFNVSPSVFNQPPQPQFETYLCELCGNNAHYGYDCSPQFPFVYEQEPYCQEALDKILEELKEIKRDRRKKIKDMSIEDMSIEEMRHEQQLVDYEIKDITNDLGYKRF
ncbi:hypothetical protein Tco_0040656 [Tanacetum coccineum]